MVRFEPHNFMKLHFKVGQKKYYSNSRYEKLIPELYMPVPPLYVCFLSSIPNDTIFVKIIKLTFIGFEEILKNISVKNLLFIGPPKLVF